MLGVRDLVAQWLSAVGKSSVNTGIHSICWWKHLISLMSIVKSSRASEHQEVRYLVAQWLSADGDWLVNTGSSPCSHVQQDKGFHKCLCWWKHLISLMSIVKSSRSSEGGEVGDLVAQWLSADGEWSVNTGSSPCSDSQQDSGYWKCLYWWKHIISLMSTVKSSRSSERGEVGDLVAQWLSAVG